MEVGAGGGRGRIDWMWRTRILQRMRKRQKGEVVDMGGHEAPEDTERESTRRHG
jgi:hypothetical protein